MGKYYWTCPLCGANLDPEEKCDCKKKIIKRGIDCGNKNKQIRA